MTLCPLFESIETPDTIKGRFQPELYWRTGIHAANSKLPREAIEAAIVAIRQCDEAREYPTRDIYAEYIEQLLALVPKE